MSWIQENKFVATLAGLTLVGAIILFVVGSRGAARYSAAKDDFMAASEEVTKFESLPLYPQDTNRDGKLKALTEYRQSIETLRDSFQKYQPESLENVAPQVFTERLTAADAEVRAAFESNRATLPDSFFMGFETYTTSLARADATGILDYQLGIIKELMLSLAASSPSGLVNLHRPRLVEEDGTVFKPDPTAVARELSLEITFRGTEEAAREFVSQVQSTENRYVVVRTVRFSNEKKDPPRSTDVKLDQAAPAASSAAAADPFAGAFVLPGDEPAADEAAEEPAADAAPVADDPAAPADSSRILAQVLGNEEVVVFLRLDILQFLPTKELVQVQN